MLILPSVVCVIFHISFSAQVAFSHLQAFPTLRRQNSQDSRSPDAQRSLRNCGVTSFVVCFAAFAVFLGSRFDILALSERGAAVFAKTPPGNVLPRRQCFSLFQSNNYQFLDFPCLTVDSVFTGQFPISSFISM